MDFIAFLSPSHGCTTILVIVGRISKYGHFVSLPCSFTSQKVAIVSVEEYIKLHGFVSKIVTDKDPFFLSDFF